MRRRTGLATRTAASIAVLALAVAFVGPARTLPAQDALSLEQALVEARAANMRLPLPAFEVQVLRAHQREAVAEKWLKVAVDGDFIYAPFHSHGYDPALTNFGEAGMKVGARQPIYAGGAIAAGVERADAAVAAGEARYRIAEKDLELDVRSRFYELDGAAAERDIRRAAIDRIRAYLRLLESRKASGQAVAGDVFKTQVRLALEESNRLDAEEHAEEARLALNQLLGREPAGPLALAPPAPLEPPAGDAGEAAPWENAPEVLQARAEARTAKAETIIARADRLPHLSFAADVGLWTSDTMHLNADFWERFWDHRGYSLAMVLSWSIWDRGALESRIAAADLGLQQAQRAVEAERYDARAKWAQARAAERRLYEQIILLTRVVPDARDSYLEAESRYRGGAGTALEVLDSYAAATEAAVKLNEVTARYRVAQAVADRWSAP
jgi:outer membrane protein TolC